MTFDLEPVDILERNLLRVLDLLLGAREPLDQRSAQHQARFVYFDVHTAATGVIGLLNKCKQDKSAVALVVCEALLSEKFKSLIDIVLLKLNELSTDTKCDWDDLALLSDEADEIRRFTQTLITREDVSKWMFSK